MPEFYDRYLGPVLFEPFTASVARRVAASSPRSVLEIAAGTGLLTAALAWAMPDAVITATDLNQAMLDHAVGMRSAPNIYWQQADAQQLPHPDSSFDVTVCQFGAMFFPDRPAAYAQAKRVLHPGGPLVLVIWESLAHNDFPRVMNEAIRAMLPGGTPLFMERIPHGYNDIDAIRADLVAGGFAGVEVDTLTILGQHASAFEVARGFMYGTPIHAAFQGDSAQADRERAVQAAADAMRAELGDGSDAITGRLTAHLVIAAS
jgi:SAM-dependent methyltransferase